MFCYEHMILEMDRNATMMGIRLPEELQVSWPAYERLVQELGSKAQYIELVFAKQGFHALVVKGLNRSFNVHPPYLNMPKNQKEDV